VADAVVFDTSAFLTLTGEEPGADTVQKLITDALAAVIQLHASFVSLTEVEYLPPFPRSVGAGDAVTVVGLEFGKSWPRS
jgi:hypothetical protein